MSFRIARRVAYLTHTALIIAAQVLTPQQVARLVISLFVIGCVWVLTGSAFLWSIPTTLAGLVLCVPAAIVASLPKGNTP